MCFEFFDLFCRLKFQQLYKIVLRLSIKFDSGFTVNFILRGN